MSEDLKRSFEMRDRMKSIGIFLGFLAVLFGFGTLFIVSEPTGECWHGMYIGMEIQCR